MLVPHFPRGPEASAEALVAPLRTTAAVSWGACGRRGASTFAVYALGEFHHLPAAGAVLSLSVGSTFMACAVN